MYGIIYHVVNDFPRKSFMRSKNASRILNQNAFYYRFYYNIEVCLIFFLKWLKNKNNKMHFG